MPPIDALVDAWCEADRGFALLPEDRAAIETTRALRALVVERARVVDADLFHASAALGRDLAVCGASPSLASNTLASLRALLPELDEASARAAGAALFEGFVTSRVETARATAAAVWEYPGCAVPLENATVAIAAGYPDDDEDAVDSWAARVASEVAHAGYRRAVLAGGARARALLFDALELAGVKVRTTSPPAPLGRRRS